MFQERRKATVVEVSVRSIMRVIGLVLATLAGIWLLLRLEQLLTLLVVAGFLAVVLTPPVDWLVRRLKIKRGLSAAVVLLVTLTALVGLGYSFLRPVVSQTSSFIDDLPAQVEQAQRGEGPVGRIVERYNIQKWVQDNKDRFSDSINGLGHNAVGLVQNVFSTLFAFVTVAVLTVLMLLQGPALLASGVGLLSPPAQERMRRIGNESARAITGYVAGNLVISAIAGLASFVFLSIIGVPFAGVLALWVAFADLIPLVGATLGAIPAVAVAFLHSVPAGIAAVLFYVLYQQFENHVLQPTIMARAVSIKPLVVMVSVLAGVELFGILGALLAIPVAAVVKVVGIEVLRVQRPEIVERMEKEKAEEAASQKQKRNSRRSKPLRSKSNASDQNNDG